MLGSYIKELADRLNTLENQLPVRHPDLQQYTQMSQGGTPPRAMNEFSPASDGAPSRKRTHSMSECLTNPAYVQAQMQRPGDRLPSIGDWSAPDAPRHLPHLASGLHIPQASQSDANHISSGYRSQVSPNGTAQPLWRYGQSDIGRRESFSIPFASNEVRPADHDHNATLLEWDDETIDEYVKCFHFQLCLPLRIGTGTTASYILHIRFCRIRLVDCVPVCSNVRLRCE